MPPGPTSLASSTRYYEAGKLELNPEPVNLTRLIDEVIGTAGQLAEKNQNRLVVEAQENVGALNATAALRERACTEKLIGAAQEFTDGEMEDAILRGIAEDDPVARNPCLRRGPLSLDYWTRLPGRLLRSTRRLVGVN